MRIHKYKIDKVNEWMSLPISASSIILCVQVQKQNIAHVGEIFAWVIESSNWTCEKEIIAVGTGIEFSEVGMKGDERYIDTVQHEGFVWHIFERINS